MFYKYYMRTKNLIPQQQAEQIIYNALATVIYATRCAVNHTMKTSSGALIFCRDMFVDVTIMTDLIAIRNNRQQLIDTDLQKHNCKCYNYHHTLCHMLMVKIYDPTKIEKKFHQPYPILELQTNKIV